MKGVIKLTVFFTLSIFLMSLVSSEIIINQQPNGVYNLGDVINIPVTLGSLTDISGTITMDLICNGMSKTFYTNGISLNAGDQHAITDASLVLTKVNIGSLIGNCKIRINLNNDYALTNSFRISNLMTVIVNSNQTTFNPGSYFFVSGNVTKEDGYGANGFVDMQLTSENTSLLESKGVISNGIFSVNVSLPKDIAAGIYLVQLDAYEQAADLTNTNDGKSSYNIAINEVPTSLEIVFENSQVQPGSSLNVKAVLHDQTGVSMNSTSFITIKDENDKIMEQMQQNTDEFLIFPIAYNQAPAMWNIYAVSNQLTAEANFQILKNEKVKIDLINKTVSITNVGNVPYNKTVLVRIGNSSFPIDVFLNIDENKKYVLAAPEGSYNIKVSTGEGDVVSGMAILTGKAMNVSEANGSIDVIGNPFIWVFVILVLGIFAFLIFNKTRKKKFFGFLSGERKKPKKENLVLSDNRDFTRSSNKAELSLSIKGEKQDVSMVCIKIRNLNEFARQGDVRETLKKINEAADEKKAVLYESQDYLFYVLVPMKTKTMQNESDAIALAQESLDILLNHNRLYKHKLEFGISLNYGTIVAKQEDTLKIMSLGTLMTSAKKVSSLAKQEILINENMNSKVVRFGRTEKETREGVNVYILRSLKQGNEQHKKFIDNFVKKYEEENRRKNE